MLVTHQIISKDEELTFLSSKTVNTKEGKLYQVISYDKNGQVVSLIEMEYPDKNTEVTKMIVRQDVESKDRKTFNEKGFLVEHIEQSMFGGFDETKYFYDDKQRLLKIIKKEEDGDQTWENFIYKEDKLFKIETANNDGESLFRGFIYDEKGRKEKMIRIQNDLVNLEVDYIYNAENQLIKEIHESVNRLKGGKNTLMTTTYEYHKNGQLKKETFKGMDSYKGKIKFEMEEIYSEKGALVKMKEIDYEEETEEHYNYEYELK